MPELCPCSLLRFWEGLGVGLSHVQPQQGFPHLAGSGGQLQPGPSSLQPRGERELALLALLAPLAQLLLGSAGAAPASASLPGAVKAHGELFVFE